MTETSIPKVIITHKVAIYRAGVMLRTERDGRKRSTPPRKKRGKVVGFSKHSAQRLRERLIRFDYSDAFGVALTAPPWTNHSPEEAWKEIAKTADRCYIDAAVWRKEVQANGTSHYHVVVWPADGIFPEACRAKIIQAWSNALHRDETALLWMYAQMGMMPAAADTPLAGAVERATRRMLAHRPDPVERSRANTIDVGMRPKNYQPIYNEQGCIRYLLDHTSKHKEYQSHTVGRPWGIVGKPPELLPEEIEFSQEQYKFLLRCLRKQSRYRQYCPCIFGHRRRWGRRYRYALQGGQHVQFGADLGRLVDWIRRNVDAPGCADAPASRAGRATRGDVK